MSAVILQYLKRSNLHSFASLMNSDHANHSCQELTGRKPSGLHGGDEGKGFRSNDSFRHLVSASVIMCLPVNVLGCISEELNPSMHPRSSVAPFRRSCSIAPTYDCLYLPRAFFQRILL